MNAQLHNHLTFRLSYTGDENGPIRIVQFEVIPTSSAYATTQLSDDTNR